MESRCLEDTAPSTQKDEGARLLRLMPDPMLGPSCIIMASQHDSRLQGWSSKDLSPFAYLST